MTALAPTVRGWCPGALRPMESGDGLIVRIRPRCGALSIADACAIADAASRCANGLIDLTRRANVQVRGLKPERLAELWAALSAHGLIDESAEAEAVRNIMVSPLAGLDPDEVADVRPIARAIEGALAADPALRRLPAKFGFIVDGGGSLPLGEERADIRLAAVRDGAVIEVALGLDRPDGTAWLGRATLETAAAAAITAARAFLAVRPDARARTRDLSERAVLDLHARLAPHLTPLAVAPAPREAQRALGVISLTGRVVAAGFAAPFGRIEARSLGTLVEAARAHGVAELRLSPWRALYAPVHDASAADALLAAATRCGFIIDASDPLLLVDACPGAPGCRSAALDTRAAARRVAPLLAAMGCRTCHVSGCAKGCARSKPADLVLVGAGDRFGLLRNDRAQGTPRVFVPPARLGELPDILSSL